MPESTAAVPTTKPLPKDIRLPLNVRPLHYNVHLRPDLYGGDPERFDFTGSVAIYVTCTRRTDRITLHMKHLDILNATIDIHSGSSEEQSPTCLSWRNDTLREFLVLSFDQQLKPGFQYRLMIHFEGKLKQNLIGIYLSSYKQGNETK